ncbi:Bug family tripartite tricarboxylate transporter substrate binding protein [Advenella kashmirensis]
MKKSSSPVGLRSLSVVTKILFVAACVSIGVHAYAQTASNYPDKAVRIVVPYPPGGANDVIARIVGQHLAQSLGKPFIIENKPGATGLTGTEQVAGAKPDGYTLLVSASVHVIYPNLFKDVRFDPLTDFTPITQLASGAMILSVNPKLPVKSVKELIQYEKSHPNELQYASSGNGSATHLAAEALKTQSGMHLQHIPYRGSAPALSDTVAGHVPLVIDPVASSQPFVEAGKLRALAVTTAKRSPSLPDLPTMAEAGLPNYDIGTWYGLWAPKGTPEVITEKLAASVKEILKNPEMQKQLRILGLEGVGSSPQAFAEYNASEAKKWRKIISESGAKMD